MNRNNRFVPIVIAISVVAGIIIGTFFSNRFSGNKLNIINSSSNKLNDLLHIIDDQYVDTVNINAVVDDAMPKILEELDPHSTYINRCAVYGKERHGENFRYHQGRSVGESRTAGR